MGVYTSIKNYLKQEQLTKEREDEYYEFDSEGCLDNLQLTIDKLIPL